jgi:pyridoxamine 5'-phosphate oxidase
VAVAQNARTFSKTDLDPDPHRQFLAWLQEAVDAGEPMPRAMALATTAPDGSPWVRMMLLEHVDERGFVFQTNLESPKARHLTSNAHAALVFFWPLPMRQVRVSGEIEPLSREEAGTYYEAEPSAIRAMINTCRQSEVIPDRAALDELFEQGLRSALESLPPHWGGYRLKVDSIEFWHGRPNWLQDRLRYSRSGSGWRVERLIP